MRYINYLALGAGALFLANVCLEQVGLASFALSSVAYAKEGKGGGNGNSGGGGNGKGGGHGNAGGGKSGSGSQGAKSGGGKGSKSRTGGVAKASQAKSGGNKSFAQGNARSSSRKADAHLVKSLSAQNVARLEKPAHRKQVALPDKITAPNWKEDDRTKNFHAKLGRLNSLNRNYHAYLNTQSPHFASLAAFVRASAELDLAQADLTAARDRLAAAEDDLGALVSSSGITAYDDAIGIYDDPTLADLQDRLGYLDSVTVAPEDEDAFGEERDALQSILNSEAARDVTEAQADVAGAEVAATGASIGTDDDSLRQALLDAANDNRVAEYGEDYVDDDMMDWAKGVLGVGDSFGKIDEVRQELEAKRGSE